MFLLFCGSVRWLVVRVKFVQWLAHGIGIYVRDSLFIGFGGLKYPLANERNDCSSNRSQEPRVYEPRARLIRRAIKHPPIRARIVAMNPSEPGSGQSSGNFPMSPARGPRKIVVKKSIKFGIYYTVCD